MRYTVAESRRIEGRGLHADAPCAVVIAPAPAGAGWRLNGAPVETLPRLDAAYATRLATPTGPVATVEHLLAAVVIAGIDDVALTVEGGEVPGLDGSAAPWLAALQPRPQAGTRRVWLLSEPVEVVDGPRRLCARPAEVLSFAVEVEHPPLPAWRAAGHALASLADARTYGFLRDAERLRAAGLARGSGWHNTAVLGDDGRCLNPEGLRSADEPARHKALDLIGDLALLGAPVCARLTARRPGHALNHRLVDALRAVARLTEA